MAPDSFGPGKDQAACEKIKRSRELLNRISAILKPYVEEIIRPLVLREMGFFQGLTEEEKQSFMSAEIEEEISDAVVDDLKSFVKSWIETFLCGQPSCDGIYYIEARKISDAMLPPLNEKDATAFQDQFITNASYLDDSQAVTILRQIRASLPDGKILPDEMVELFALWRVKIV